MQFLSQSIFTLLTYLVAKKKDQVAVTKNQAFRAIRRALLQCKDYVTGLLTDTNSSVANLAPQLEHDPSVCINNWLPIYLLKLLVVLLLNNYKYTIGLVYN